VSLTVTPPNTAPNIQGTDTVVVGGPLLPFSLAQNSTGTTGTGGRITIGTYQGRPIPEPHRIYKWEIDLPQMSIPATSAGTDATTIPDPIVQEVSCTFDNTVPSSHPIGGRHRFLADTFDTTALMLTFYNDEDQTPIRYINAWKALIRTLNTSGEGEGMDNGLYQYPTTYLKPIYLYLQDLKTQTRMKISFLDCFPSVSAPMKLDYRPTNSITEVHQEFIINRVKMDATPANNLVAYPPMPGSPSKSGGKIFGIQTLQP